MNRIPLVALAMALALALLGAVQTLAFVHTAWWPLPLLSMAVLVAVLDRCTARRAAVLAWAYGTGWLAAGVWWLFVSMHRYGGLPAWMAAAAVLALAAALSLYLAGAGALYARWRTGRAVDALLWAALFLMAEWARGVLFTGFPWVALGYAQVDAPLAALAPWVGVYGVGAAGAGLAAWAAQTARPWLRLGPGSAAGWSGQRRFGRWSRPSRWVAPLLAVAGLAWLSVLPVAQFTQPAGTLTLALLQSNVQQNEKFAVEHLPRTLAWVNQQLRTAKADLVLVPETAIPLLPSQLEEAAPGYWKGLQAHFAAPGRMALVGLPLGDFEQGYTNSVVALGGNTPPGPSTPVAPYRYDKYHLVPFGEFIPTGFRWFTQLMGIPLGDFTRGHPTPPSVPVSGQRVALNICYEDLFGEELARRFGAEPQAPTLFANVSNIGWFGQTSAVAQHLNISRLRTLEFQRPMVRATNTGATASVDHQGRVLAQLPPHTQGVLTSPVQGRVGLTPYARWAAAWGLVPLALGALAVVAMFALWHRSDASVRRTRP